MKICDITQFYSPVSGGVKRYVGEKRDYVRECTEDEHVLIVPGAENRVVEEGRLRTYTIASPLISKLAQYRALLSLHLVEEILERERPDLIESGDPYQVAWRVIGCGRLYKIPVVGFYHSHFPEANIRAVSRYFGRMAIRLAEVTSIRYVRLLYNQFARTLVPSPGLGQVLSEWGVKNVANVDLGVNGDAFFPDDGVRDRMRGKLGISPKMRVLIYVGRLAPEKNVKVLLRAFELLRSRSPGRFCLVIIGDGACRGEVAKLMEKSRARKAGASDRQLFAPDLIHVPYCSNLKDLADWYRTADFMVHPSVNETFGLVTLESQACGTPVVGFQGSYMDRIIFTDQNCWALERTPEALAEAIVAMGSRNDADLRAIGISASQAVRSRFCWPSIFAKLFAIYREVIDGYNR